MAFNLNEEKTKLVNIVCASLFAEPRFNQAGDPRAEYIAEVVEAVASKDPEFILKTALYVRDDLGIRSTANYLLALAANIPECGPFIKKYFLKAVRLPSDWLDVAALYQMLPDRRLQGRALPTSLRKALAFKFPQFDGYQLAKYNKENSMKRKRKKAKELAAKLQKEGKPTPPPPQKPLTIKQLIRQVHIKQPVPHVMCILGKKYPPDALAFRDSGLAGNFDETRIGKRMKLPVPETWETLLSAKGNKAFVWEELIDNRKLPFMAMLRNLRNLILTGVSPRHHRWVISKLCDERTVANSRQFPFSFFTAYEAINIDIDQLAIDIADAKANANNPTPAPAARGRGAAAPRGGRGGRGGARGGAEVPFERKKKVLIPVHMPTKELIQQYKNALDTAVKCATVHNVKPIRGATLVLCDVSDSMCSGSLPGSRSVGRVKSLLEVGILLGLMCKYMCEECDFQLFAGHRNKGLLAVQLQEGTILDNMDVVKEASKQLGDEFIFPFTYLDALLEQRKKIDNIIVLSDRTLAPHSPDLISQRPGGLARFLQTYRQEINPDLLYVCVNLKGDSSLAKASPGQNHPNDILVSGFSDAILKYVAERGDGNQIEYIQHIDTAKQLDSLSAKLQQRLDRSNYAAQAAAGSGLWSFMDSMQNCKWEGCPSKVKKEHLDQHMLTCVYRVIECPEPSCPEKFPFHQKDSHLARCYYRLTGDSGRPSAAQKWREVKVFVSSTFLDMHGERDILVRRVFPEIRAFCKKKKIHFFDVDLRWGVTQEESEQLSSALDVCLHNLATCRPFFIGLLGDRYGWVPDARQRALSATDPDLAWLAEYPEGRSVTELEFYFGALQHPGAIGSAIYLRDSRFTNQVPQEHRDAFISSQSEHQQLLRDLKERIKSNCHYQEYSASWHGVQDGKPMAGSLDHFAEQVTRKLKSDIEALFPDDDSVQGEDSIGYARSLHEEFLEEKSRRFVGRQNLLSTLFKFVDAPQSENADSLFVIQSEPGFGKTSLTAKFCRDFLEQRPGAFLLPHFIGAAPNSADIRSILYRICSELKREYTDIVEEVPETYKELKQAFPRFLEQAAFGKRCLLVIDSLDKLIDDNNRALSLDWLPTLPGSSGVRIIVSTYSNTPTAQILALRQPELPSFIVPALEETDRKDLVRQTLQEYSKKLDESPTNNQMRMLLRKSEGCKPLWLSIACQELRMFGVYEKVTEEIKRLPPTISTLLAYVLQRLEGDYGRPLVTDLSSFLVASRNGLSQTELLELLADTPITLPSASTPAANESDSLSSDDPFGSSYFSSSYKAKKKEEVASASGERLSVARWAHIHRGLERFLRHVGHGETSTIQFFHQEMSQASIKRYLGRGKEKLLTNIHTRLAAFFMKGADPLGDRSWQSNDRRAVSELPYHLLLSGQTDELHAVLTDFGFLSLKIRLGMVFPLVQDIYLAVQGSGISLDDDMEETDSFDYQFSSLMDEEEDEDDETVKQREKTPLEALRECLSFITANSHLLSQYPALTFQQAANQPDSTHPAQKAVQLWDQYKSHVSLPPIWLQWRNKPQENDSCTMTLAGYAEAMLACTVSPDGRRMVCASRDRTLKVIDVASGAEIATLVGHSNWVVDCAYSPDGSTLASASWDNTVKVWNPELGSLLYTLQGHTRRVSACCFSHDGKRLLSGSWDCSVKLWNLSDSNSSSSSFSNSGDGEASKEIKAEKSLTGHNKPVSAVAFSPNDRLAVSASWDTTVKVWDLSTGKTKYVLTGHTQSVRSVAFAPNGRQIVSTSSDNSIRVWDMKRQQQIASFHGHNQPVNSCAFSADGKHLLSASEDQTIKIWDALGGSQVASMKLTGGSHGNGIAIAAHGRAFSSAHHASPIVALACSDCCAVIIDLRTGKELGRVGKGVHTRSLTKVAFSADGNLLATAGEDYLVAIWKGTQLLCVLEQHQDSVHSVCFHPKDPNRLVTASEDFRAFQWNIKTPSNPIHQTILAHPAAVLCARYSHDGKQIITSSKDGVMRLFHAETYQQIQSFHGGHKDWITECALSPDGLTLASASWDFGALLWNVSSGQIVHRLEGHQGALGGIAWSPDSKRAVTCSFDTTLKLWDAVDGVLITTIEGHSQRVNHCAWSTLYPSSEAVSQVGLAYTNMIVSCGDDGTVKVWDSSSGAEVNTFQGHSDTVCSITFSPDKSKVISASEDCTVKVWDAFNSKGSQTQAATSLQSNEQSFYHGQAVYGTSISADGSLVASASRDLTVAVWDIETGNLRSRFEHHTKSVNSCDFSTKDDLVVSGSDDCRVVAWNATSGEIVQEYGTRGKAHANPVTCVRFSPNGAMLASTSWDTAVNVYRTNSPVPTKLGNHSDWVNSCSWNASSTHLLTASHDSSIMLWNVNNRSSQVIGSHSNWALAANYAPCGTKAVSGGFDSVAKIWDLNTQRCVSILNGHDKRVNDCLFNASGRLVASVSHDRSVRIWDVRSTEVVTLFVTKGWATCLSSRNDTVAAGDSLGNVYLLDIMAR